VKDEHVMSAAQDGGVEMIILLIAIFQQAKPSQVKSRFAPQMGTQAKYTEQSVTNVPLQSTGTQGAPCRKQQAGRE